MIKSTDNPEGKGSNRVGTQQAARLEGSETATLYRKREAAKVLGELKVKLKLNARESFAPSSRTHPVHVL